MLTAAVMKSCRPLSSAFRRVTQTASSSISTAVIYVLFFQSLAQARARIPEPVPISRILAQGTASLFRKLMASRQDLVVWCSEPESRGGINAQSQFVGFGRFFFMNAVNQKISGFHRIEFYNVVFQPVVALQKFFIVRRKTEAAAAGLGEQIRLVKGGVFIALYCSRPSSV